MSARSMSRPVHSSLSSLDRSVPGRKVWLAIAGLTLSAWTFLHMAGNLLVFAGPDVMNGYGAALQGSPLLWLMRGGLLFAIGVHVAYAVQLVIRNRMARPIAYARRGVHGRWSASRTMALGGPLILAFVIYHLLHIYGPWHGSFVPGDVHHNLVTGLRSPPVAAAYVIATAIFGLHLHHGMVSALTTLGASRSVTRRVTPLARGFATAVTGGFLLPCVGVAFGWV